MTVWTLILAFVIGAALGAAYFALLWTWVRHFTGGAQPWLLAVGGVLRVALVLAAIGAFAVSGRPLGELAAAALGFILARLAATRLARRREEDG